MSIMFCDFNMFELKSSVLKTTDEIENYPIFTGTFNEVCDFMSTEYQTHQYDKIVLAGPYATAVENYIRAYSRINYNLDDIEIEVLP